MLRIISTDIGSDCCIVRFLSHFTSDKRRVCRTKIKKLEVNTRFFLTLNGPRVYYMPPNQILQKILFAKLTVEGK